MSLKNLALTLTVGLGALAAHANEFVEIKARLIEFRCPLTHHEGAVTACKKTEDHSKPEIQRIELVNNGQNILIGTWSQDTPDGHAVISVGKSAERVDSPYSVSIHLMSQKAISAVTFTVDDLSHLKSLSLTGPQHTEGEELVSSALVFSSARTL